MKKNHLMLGSRRNFLKNVSKAGLGSGLVNGALAGSGLLWTRGALGQGDIAKKKLITIHITNGAHPDTWHANGTGADFTLPEGSSPFAAEGIKEHCVFLDGLTGQGGHGHHHQCVSNNQKTSLDMYAASKLSADTPYSSLQLAASPEGSLSRINGNGIPFEMNPVKMYDRLFPEPIGGDGKDWRTIRRQGVLGANLKMLGDFKKNLNTTQQERLDLHAESIQALSERIQRAAAGTGDAACTRPFWDGLVTDTSLLEAESLSGAATEIRTKLSMDLIALAFKCDLTRVATFSFGHSGADIMVPPVGQTWHGCQHGYQNNINNPIGRKWFSQQMVYLMDLLASEQDTDGSTLLDNTLIYLTSDMGNGSSHNNARHPIVLAGGLVNGGQAIDMGGVFWDPLFDTIADSLGILTEEDYPGFGNGAGPISGVVRV